MIPENYDVIEQSGSRIIYLKSEDRLRELIPFTGRIGQPSNMRGRTVINTIEPDLVVRHLSHGGALRKITGERFLNPSRSLRELNISCYLREAGIKTPEILAIRIVRQGIFCNIAVISRLVPDSEDFLTRMERDSAECNVIMHRTGRLIRKMHDLNIYHADLHIKNILLDHELKPMLLDLDAASHHQQLGEKMKARNLNRYIRSCNKWIKKGRITLPDGWQNALEEGYEN